MRTGEKFEVGHQLAKAYLGRQSPDLFEHGECFLLKVGHGVH